MNEHDVEMLRRQSEHDQRLAALRQTTNTLTEVGRLIRTFGCGHQHCVVATVSELINATLPGEDNPGDQLRMLSELVALLIWYKLEGKIYE